MTEAHLRAAWKDPREAARGSSHSRGERDGHFWEDEMAHISVSKCLWGASLCPTLHCPPSSLWAEINGLEGYDKQTLLPETFVTEAFVP